MYNKQHIPVVTYTEAVPNTIFLELNEASCHAQPGRTQRPTQWNWAGLRDASIYTMQIPLFYVLSQGDDSDPSPADFAVAVTECSSHDR